MDHQRILSRVQKMLNLANCEGATEGERDNALRMAHATLAKHNLEMADLDEVKRESMAGEERTENTGTFYGRPWARAAASAVARLFFCSYIFVTHKKATRVKHYFIGRRSNAMTAALIAEFVVKSIIREGNRQKRREGQGNAWLRSFCWGAARRVQQRVREIRDAAEQPQSNDQPGTALVIVYDNEQRANELWLAQMYPSLQVSRTRGKGVSDSDAYGRGDTYGRSVSLNTQIGG